MSLIFQVTATARKDAAEARRFLEGLTTDAGPCFRRSWSGVGGPLKSRVVVRSNVFQSIFRWACKRSGRGAVRTDNLWTRTAAARYRQRPFGSIRIHCVLCTHPLLLRERSTPKVCAPCLCFLPFPWPSRRIPERSIMATGSIALTLLPRKGIMPKPRASIRRPSSGDLHWRNTRWNVRA